MHAGELRHSVGGTEVRVHWGRAQGSGGGILSILEKKIFERTERLVRSGRLKKCRIGSHGSGLAPKTHS